MKKLFLVLTLIPIITFSQVSSWRSGSSSGTRSFSSSVGRTNNISSWRNSSPNEFNRPQPSRRGSNIIINDPWGWNRWNMWGAPVFGWSYWEPMWYLNNWGYRQPGRIYVYEDGRKDTIKGKRPIINFVLSKTTNNQIGVSFAVGNKDYFIMDFVSTYNPDYSTFFPFGNITQVDFPLINDLKKEMTIYVGGGKRFNRTGVHGMVGFGNEIIRWRGKDSFGEITFPKYRSNFVTMKVGVMQDIKNLTLKFDIDPIRDYTQFGVGLNF